MTSPYLTKPARAYAEYLHERCARALKAGTPDHDAWRELKRLDDAAGRALAADIAAFRDACNRPWSEPVDHKLVKRLRTRVASQGGTVV